MDRRIAEARAAFGTGRHAEAERLAEAVLVEDGDALDAIEVIVLARRAAGDIETATRWLERAISIAPKRRWPRAMRSRSSRR